MADKFANITNALATLEKQYVEHKETFEKWKSDNVKQQGSETYNNYVEQFNQWEAGVQEQKRLLVEEGNNLLAYPDVDKTLDLLLSRISFEDFITAVATMTSKDPSFFASLLSASEKILPSGEKRTTNPYQTFSSAGNYAANFPHPYSLHQYGLTASMPPVTAAYSQYTVVRPDVMVGNGAVKRSFERIAPVTSTSDVWKVEEPARKSYRPPSPVKDYRNPSTLPFRDFSQT